jgi:hypothetical protein
MDFKQSDLIGNILIIVLFSLLIYASVLYYKSIDWDVLKKLESQSLILPSPAISTSSAQKAEEATPTASNTNKNN